MRIRNGSEAEHHRVKPMRLCSRALPTPSDRIAPPAAWFDALSFAEPVPTSPQNPLWEERGDARATRGGPFVFRHRSPSIRSSLQARLVALWIALLASAVATAYLLFGLYTQSTAVQISQAEIAVGRACRGRVTAPCARP